MVLLDQMIAVVRMLVALGQALKFNALKVFRRDAENVGLMLQVPRHFLQKVDFWIDV